MDRAMVQWFSGGGVLNVEGRRGTKDWKWGGGEGRCEAAKGGWKVAGSGRGPSTAQAPATKGAVV
jgi:hypothetical protein